MPAWTATHLFCLTAILFPLFSLQSLILTNLTSLTNEPDLPWDDNSMLCYDPALQKLDFEGCKKAIEKLETAFHSYSAYLLTHDTRAGAVNEITVPKKYHSHGCMFILDFSSANQDYHPTVLPSLITNEANTLARRCVGDTKHHGTGGEAFIEEAEGGNKALVSIKLLPADEVQGGTAGSEE